MSLQYAILVNYASVYVIYATYNQQDGSALNKVALQAFFDDPSRGVYVKSGQNLMADLRCAQENMFTPYSRRQVVRSMQQSKLREQASHEPMPQVSFISRDLSVKITFCPPLMHM